MDSPSTGFGLFQFASLEPSLLNYTPSPYRSPSNSRTRNLVYSPVKTLGIEPSYEAIEAMSIYRELEESLGFSERWPIVFPHLVETSLPTANIPARLVTTPDDESGEMESDDIASVSDGHTITNAIYRRRSVTPIRREGGEDAPEPPSPISTSSSPPGSSVEVTEPSIVHTTNNIQSQSTTETGGSSIDVKGLSVFPRPTNKSDVLFLLGEGVHVSQFVEHKKIGNDWYCSGKYALERDGRFLRTRTPCRNFKLSSKDNLDRHVKREHFNMRFDVSTKILGLRKWAKACKYKLPPAKRHSKKCRIDWATPGSYPEPKSA